MYLSVGRASRRAYSCRFVVHQWEEAGRDPEHQGNPHSFSLKKENNVQIHAEKGTYTVTIKDITCEYSGKVGKKEEE